MALYKTRGIVLGSRPFDESAKLVTFLTKDHGKIVVIAKGAKRPTSKFGGRLETFTYADLLLAKGRSLDILSQMEVRESFQKIRENPAWLNLAFYFIKIVEASSLQGHKNEQLFKLLLASFKKIIDNNASETIDYIVKFFEVNYLRVEGLYQKGGMPEDIITDHLEKDVKWWKRQVLPVRDL